MVSWLGSPYNAEAFDRAAVVFGDPRARWRMAFAEEAVDLE